MGVAYPAIKSMQALETSEKNDDRLWLTYWIIYGFTMFLDDYAGFVLQYFPFYYFAKVCFLLWLFNPATNGALIVYNNTLKPMLRKYQLPITDLINFTTNIAMELYKGEKKRVDMSPKKTRAEKEEVKSVKTPMPTPNFYKED